METTRKYKRLRAWSIVLAIVLCGSVIGHCIHIYFTDQSTAYSRKLRLPDITPNSTHMNFSQHPDILAVMNDTQLHKVFYGITYTPDNAQYPDCQVSMKAVTRDIALLSQLTSRIRLYGTDCNQVDHVLMAIQDLGVDMTISIGLWIDRKLEVSLRQFIDLQEILSRYPHKLIDSIYVGNEVLFREDATVMELTGYIRYVKEYLKRNHIVKPVATSEIGSKWNPALAKEVDIVSANIHPFFGGIDVEHSTIWTFDFLVDYIARNINATSETKFIISEIGWPTEGEPLKRARPGVRELQRFLDSWVCLNQGDEVGWYWFEAFDEPWKAKSWDESTKWEPHWGLFTPDRRLKNIRIPSCI
ncbi:hypothetical protein TRVA0_006S00738 [Trichomonascus vanleenenianus]|uniref:uncharacterized protein n=1 Tax=Trichomonascus vanleenenianus TaxID=2268995 RepID=UPI003ECAE3BA